MKAEELPELNWADEDIFQSPQFRAEWGLDKEEIEFMEKMNRGFLEEVLFQTIEKKERKFFFPVY